MQEILGDAESLELPQGRLMTVSAGDGMQDSPLVKNLDDRDHLRAQPQ